MNPEIKLINFIEKIINQLNRKNTIELATEKINAFKSSSAPTRKDYYLEPKTKPQPAKQQPKESKKDYVITGNVEYLILNWDAKEKKYIPSKIRNRNFQ